MRPLVRKFSENILFLALAVAICAVLWGGYQLFGERFAMAMNLIFWFALLKRMGPPILGRNKEKSK